MAGKMSVQRPQHNNHILIDIRSAGDHSLQYCRVNAPSGTQGLKMLLVTFGCLPAPSLHINNGETIMTAALGPGVAASQAPVHKA